jgi:hypothetical protein
MKKPFITLSKSKIKQGLNCHKALYFSVYQSHLATYSNQSKKALSTGIEVGKIARTHFPGGILIQDYKWKDKMETTKKALITGKPIFEGTFSFNQVPIQVDILEPVAGGGFNLIEVKSGLSAKDDYLEDAAIQYYVLQGLKVQIKDVYIWFVNKKATGEADLFTKELITPTAQQLALKVPQVVQDLMKVVADENVIPDVKIGSHCVFPYECPFKSTCWKNVPQENSIFQIPNFSDKWLAFKEGIINIEDPRLTKYNIKPEVIEAIKNNQMWLNEEVLISELKKYQWPLNSLDFETLQVSIPKFEHTYPYQQIPFQFSLHILNSDGTIRHEDFLFQSEGDPRRALAEALVAAMPSQGTILAYNAKFEAQVCQELGLVFLDLQPALQSIVDRLVDPWLLLKDNLYHPAFKSSYSLKSVAPALLGPEYDYKNLAIKDGLEAQAAFIKMVNSESLPEKMQLDRDLRVYCGADTINLIKLYQYLAQILKLSI